MSWYHLILSSGGEELVRDVWRAAEHAGVPLRDQAVFVRSKSEGRLALYFTPSAARLARIFGASRCRQPSPRRLEVLLGDAVAQQPLQAPRAVATTNSRRNGNKVLPSGRRGYAARRRTA